MSYSDDSLNEYHIKQVWEYLQERFGFDLKGWKKKFEEFRNDPRVLRSGHENTIESHFSQFGNKHIDPVLNQILCRREGYETFNKMVRYIMTRKSQR